MKESFQDLLRPELFLSISGDGELLIKENDKCAILRKLRIMGVPDGSVAFELDYTPKGQLKKKPKNAFSQLSCLVCRSHPNANKRCDFVIISPGKGKSKIILGEMKSRSPKSADCFAQLRNSELYVNYLLSLLSEYHEQEITPEYKKVVLFVGLPISTKAPTQQKHKQRPKVRDGITYVPVTVAGRNNSQATISYPLLI